MTHQSDLNALIGSRICHDLISPLGAIGNGVELLSMSGIVGGPEMSLISESVANANARIKYFRIAFGAASKGQSVSQSEILRIIKDYTQGGRVMVDWQARPDLPRPEVKLAFLLLQCFESAMPWGGNVTITVLGDQWAITGESERLNLKPDLWQELSLPGHYTDLEAAEVHFALAPLAAEGCTRKLTVESSDQTIRVRF